MKKILIVENEPDIQELLCAYLGEAAFFYGRYFHWYQLGRLMIFLGLVVFFGVGGAGWGGSWGYVIKSLRKKPL